MGLLSKPQSKESGSGSLLSPALLRSLVSNAEQAAVLKAEQRALRREEQVLTCKIGDAPYGSRARELAFVKLNEWQRVNSPRLYALQDELNGLLLPAQEAVLHFILLPEERELIRRGEVRGYRGYYRLRSQYGACYRIYTNASDGNIFLESKGKLVGNWCASPQDAGSMTAKYAAQALMLKADELGFWIRANTYTIDVRFDSPEWEDLPWYFYYYVKNKGLNVLRSNGAVATNEHICAFYEKKYSATEREEHTKLWMQALRDHARR